MRPALGLSGNDPRRPLDISSEKPTPGKVIVVETIAEPTKGEDNTSVLILAGLAVLALFMINR